MTLQIKGFVIYGLILLLSAQSCKNLEKKKPETSKPEKTVVSAIKFEFTSFDFGNIAYDSDGKCYFTFTNTSKVPLVINRVMTSCGCTSPEWPGEPLQPKGKDKISITYNTQITGNFRKSITVYSNAEGSPHKLIIQGNVVP